MLQSNSSVALADSSSEPKVQNQTQGADATEKLTEAESQQLVRLETAIENGIKSFLEVGKALAEINTSRLYRQTHKTFEDYVRDRFGIERGTAYGYIQAAQVHDNLVAANLVSPQNEYQVRPLAKLSAEDQITAWKMALTEANGGKVTHSHTKAAADEVEGKTQPVEFLAAEERELDPDSAVRYLHGTVTDHAEKIAAKSVDLLLVTNLPGENEEDASCELDHLLDEADGFMKDDSQALVFCPFLDPNPLYEIAKQRGFEIGVPVYRDSGKSSKTVGFSFLNSVDVILHFRRGEARLHEPTSNVIVAEDESPKLHPSQRPVALLSDLISSAVAPGAVVLDPTAGIGSSAIACQSTGRTCIAVESDERAYKIGVDRLKANQVTPERNDDHE